MQKVSNGVRGAGLALMAGVMLLAAPVLACTAPGNAAALRGEVIAWINVERRAQGLAPLRDSDTLQQAATAHACDMAERGYFAHQRPGGPTLTQRLRKSGYRFRAANENIAMTSSGSVAQVTSLWRNSPKHLQNVLDPKVREVGVGVAQSGDQIYWVTNAGSS